jgi:hypothetical protein
MRSLTRRVFVAIREGRGASAAKRLVKRALGKLVRAVARRPMIRRYALVCIDRVPSLKSRLRGFLNASPDRPSSSDELSPRARLVYGRLKRQHDHRNGV